MPNKAVQVEHLCFLVLSIEKKIICKKVPNLILKKTSSAFCNQSRGQAFLQFINDVASGNCYFFECFHVFQLHNPLTHFTFPQKYYPRNSRLFCTINMFHHSFIDQKFSMNFCTPYLTCKLRCLSQIIPQYAH